MPSFHDFIEGYESVIHNIAQTTVYTLELIGILIIILGTIRVLWRLLTRLKYKKAPGATMFLRSTLALALEFKMGAEIVNTVIVRDLKELVVLAFVIALRALLAIFIHWQIKNEKKEAEAAKLADGK